MKYQKPLVKDLSKISFAEGACASGAIVGQCGPNGLQAGTCSRGWTAGLCSVGNTQPMDCVGTGIMGYGAPNCNPYGNIAQM